MKWTNKQITFGVIFILSIFLVFFVGREVNEETGKRSFVISMDGITQFRK